MVSKKYEIFSNRKGHNLNEIFTLSAWQTKTDTFANTADTDETAHNELSHQYLQCLLCRY